MRRGGLGKGLDALIPPDVRRSSAGAYQELPLTSIRPNDHQPRSHFDEEALRSLADSIQAVGVLQPVLVRDAGGGSFELIAGERRWRAARRAGLQRIPAVVQQVDDRAALERAVVENLHRQDLSPMEEAGAYQQLIEDFGLSHEELARRVGKSRSAVTNALRLFQLPPSAQRLVADGSLSAGHARALLGTPDRALQEGLAERAVRGGWSVRALEDEVRRRPPRVRTQARARGAPTRPPGVAELEELLSACLDTRVAVDMRAERGRVVVEFATLGDLERLYRTIARGAALGQGGELGSHGPAGEWGPGPPPLAQGSATDRAGAPPALPGEPAGGYSSPGEPDPSPPVHLEARPAGTPEVDPHL